MPHILTYDKSVNRFFETVGGVPQTYQHEDFYFVWPSSRIFPSLTIEGEEVDMLSRRLAHLPDEADGILVFPYDAREKPEGGRYAEKMVRVSPFSFVRRPSYRLRFLG